MERRNRPLGRIAALLLPLLVLLSGCASEESKQEAAKEAATEAMQKAQEVLQPAMNKAGQAVEDVVEGLKNAEYQGGPFQNNLESARAYLLQELQEKYGIEFAVVWKERLKNYGPFSGASYSCEAAPVDAPEKITKALVSQTAYQDVHDNYALYYFKEAAERPAYALCESKPYVQKYQITLEAPGTEKTWTAEDGLETYLAQSGASVKIRIGLSDGLETQTYAEQILDFLHSVKTLPSNILLQVRAEKTYIFHQEIPLLEGNDPTQTLTLEKIVEEIEENLSMGDPI